MENNELEKVTASVLHYITDRRVKRIFFCEKLDLSMPTFKKRLEKHTWSTLEIEKLRSLNIVK